MAAVLILRWSRLQTVLTTFGIIDCRAFESKFVELHLMGVIVETRRHCAECQR